MSCRQVLIWDIADISTMHDAMYIDHNIIQARMRVKSHVNRLTFVEGTIASTWCNIMSQEEQSERGMRKVHAFMQGSTALVWDAHGR